jgi:arylsulfatase A-like enzyme
MFVHCTLVFIGHCHWLLSLAMALGVCSSFLLLIIGVVLPYISYLSLQSEHYLFSLLRVLYKANTEEILPNIPVKWLERQPKRILSTKPNKDAPNIIIILADDLGFNDISGGAGVPTPFIDSIRDNGMTFTQAYSAQATCAPSRAALFTGRMPTKMGFEFTPTPKFFGKLVGDITKLSKIEYPPVFRAHLYKDTPHMEELQVPRNYSMLPEMLKYSGYDTYFMGKWDNGFKEMYTPLNRGYDESLGFIVGAAPYGDPRDKEIVGAKGVPLDTLLFRITNCFVSHNNGPRFRPSKYMTDYLTDEAVSLIRALGGREEKEKFPWLLTLAYNAPHNPFQALARDFYHEELAHIEDHNLRVYAAMIRALDRGVGEILQVLKETNQYDNTIVLFTSDNGGASYVSSNDLNKPFRGFKATFFEGGIRVPTFLQWPRLIPAKSQFNAPVIATDFVPTLLSAASNAHYNDEQRAMMHDLDGVDLLPRLLNIHGSNREDKRTLYWRSGAYKAMRLGNHKLMLNDMPNKMWYFNLLLDPTEQYNLVNERLQLETAGDVEEVRQRKDELCANSKIRSTEDLEENTNDMTKEDLLCQLIVLYEQLLKVDGEQIPSLWPSLASVAICIDHHAGIPCKKGEEYSYFAN